jgi:hypothetical protein
MIKSIGDSAPDFGRCPLFILEIQIPSLYRGQSRKTGQSPLKKFVDQYRNIGHF